MPLIAVFLVSALTALLVTPAVVRFAHARGVFGVSRESAHHGGRVPRLGGIAVCIAMTGGVAAAALLAPAVPPIGAEDPARFYGGLLLAGWILFLAGLVDDLHHLPPHTKFLAQLAAALVAYAFGFRIETVGFGDATMALGWVSLPLTVLWMVGVTNAFNLIDGLDGLATGIGLVALATTFLVSLLLGNLEVAAVCAALGGALVGFLRYNLRPARIFLGDSGSLFVGFMLAVLSVHGSTKSTTAVLAIIPMLVLALPILDTTLSIVRRWLRGTPVWDADERHLHHRLLAVGLTHVRAVVVLYVLAIGLAVIAMVLAFAPPPVVAATSIGGAVASTAVLLYGIKRLGYHEFVEAGVVVTSGLARVRQSIRDLIHARDVAAVIARAETEEHLRAILADNASALGFLDIVFCAESAATGGRPELPPQHSARAWKLEFPVPARSADPHDPWVLRIWCDPREGARLAGGGRVVRVLADAVAAWLQA
ncbi:MAG TPA: MraY family glycosyltransferase, partial [Longimicrobiaceae bacterium]|nr:MraY family glycosyltransferase [Longimicrobiaceae bacterium]